MENEIAVPFKYYARMWPREVFFRACKKKRDAGLHETPARLTKRLYRTIDLLTKPGVYVLYRDDVPYYVGQAEMLRSRLAVHARVPQSRYFNHWNFFSAFVIEDKEKRNLIERVLIAAMPTANGAKPLKREPFDKEVTRMVREMHVAKANPLLGSANEDETDEDES